MGKEILLGALVTTEIQKMDKKFDFYGVQTGIPGGESWIAKDSLTLEQFLDKHPSPSIGEDITIYGIAWEFIWGKKPPQDVLEARQNLLIRARTGMEVTEEEKLWLKIIAVDTDMF